MKRIFLILFLFPFVVNAQQLISGRPITMAANSATNPVTSGLVEDFNFGDPSKVTVVSGNISSITGEVGSTVSSQATVLSRPVYNSFGGPNNYGYGQFNNSYLTGSLVLSGTNYTIISLKKCDVTTLQASFYNGGAADGFGIVDGTPPTAAIKAPGGLMLGNSLVETLGSITYTGAWLVEGISHSSGLNKYYGNTGYKYNVVQATANPVTPTTGHNIGYLPGTGPYQGGIARILIYNRQLTDAEMLSVMQYMRAYYRLPLATNFNSGGDSITFGYNVDSGYPQRVMTSLIGSQYMYNNNTAINGYTTGQVLDSLNSTVLTKYNSSINNVYTLMVGRNNLTGSIAAAAIYAGIVSICQQAKSAGYRVVIMTVLKSTNEIGNPTALANWTALNTLIRNNWASFADAIYDTALITDALDPTNTTYFQDGVHPTDALDTEIAAGLASVLTLLIYN